MSTVANVLLYNPPPLPLPQIGPALQRAMQKDPAARFVSIQDFVAALGARRAFSAAVSPATVNTTQGEVAIAGHRSRKRARATLVGLTLAVVALFMVVKLFIGGSATSRVSAMAVDLSPGRLSVSAVPTVAPPPVPPTAPVPTALPVAEAEDVLPPVASGILARSARSPAAPARPSEAGAKLAVQRPVVSTIATSPAGTSGSSGFEVSIVGASEVEQKPIKQCCIKELKSLTGMPRTYGIVLQRSGTLHIVGAPEEVRQTDLGLCLRNAFPPGAAPAAVTVTVHARGSR